MGAKTLQILKVAAYVGEILVASTIVADFIQKIVRSKNPAVENPNTAEAPNPAAVPNT